MFYTNVIIKVNRSTYSSLEYSLCLCSYEGGPPQNLEFIYKKLCIYSYIFKLQSPSKYSPFDAIYLSRCFFHCSKQFVNLLIVMPLSASDIFCFTSSTSAKHFLLRTFFIQGNKQKSSLGQDRVNRESGAGGHAVFGQKLLNTQSDVGRCTRKSPIMKWANVLTLQKKVHWSQTQLLTTMPTDTDGFLEHPPSKRSLYYKETVLQKVSPDFGGPPRIMTPTQFFLLFWVLTFYLEYHQILIILPYRTIS